MLFGFTTSSRVIRRFSSKHSFYPGGFLVTVVDGALAGEALLEKSGIEHIPLCAAACLLFVAALTGRLEVVTRLLVNAQDFDLVLPLAIAGKKCGHLPGHSADYYRYLDRSSLACGPRRQYWGDYDKAVSNALELLESKGQLTAERKKDAAEKLHSWLGVCMISITLGFRSLVRRVRRLDPSFIPNGSLAYRAIVGLSGFSAAEWLAFVSRKIRIRWRPS